MISDELIQKAGLPLIGRLAKLPREEARHVLLRSREYSEEEIEELLTVCKALPQESKQIDYFADRRICLAILWILGGSWSQIGELYQVSRQTVMDGAHKVMKGRRDRIAQRVTYERLSEFNAKFWKNQAEGTLPSSRDPWDVAHHIALTTERDDED